MPKPGLKLAARESGDARWIGAFALVAIASAFASPAVAENAATANAPVGVMDQSRPEYDAQGLALGNWTLFPVLSVTGNYDDNIFRLQQQRSSDWYLETTPGARLVRKWEDGAFALSGSADNFAYAQFGRLDLTDWTVGAEGNVTLAKGLTLTGLGSYGEYHESFEAAEVIGEQLSYTRFYHGHAESHLNYEQGDWIVGGGAAFERYDWGPTITLSHLHLSNSDRDESVIAPYAKAAYQFTPGYHVFVRAVYDARNFDDNVRSSSGDRIDAGIAFAPDKILNGEVYLGWLRQDFKPPLPDFSALDYGATIDWYPLKVLTMHLTAVRTASDVVLPGFSVSDDQSFRLSADYEARHDVIVQAFAAYISSRLVGTVPRTDHYPAAGITLRYLINRYASAEVAYLYTSRHSAPNPLDVLNFRDQVFTAGLRLHI